MSYQTKSKGLYRGPSLSLSQRKPIEYSTITTPNLLDLQLNLPDPINRQPFSVVRGVKMPTSYTQPNLTLYHPPQKPSQSNKLQHSTSLQPSLPHRQYTAPEFGNRQKLATNTLQQRPHSQYSSQQRTSTINLTTNSEEPKTRQETRTPFYTRETKLSESVDIPGVPVIYRSDEIKKICPDRLNLENRHLTVMPIFEKEEQLRLLNLQMNMISRIQHLSSLRNLIFLDLYDNLISEITGLDCLVSLRVLMLGKNRIKIICGLDNLKKLDVLDLHGNVIRVVENLSNLTNLRVLNLAGNELSVVSGLENLTSLTELNFRRNKILNVDGLNELPQLQKLFLAHNCIVDIENLNNSLYSASLRELTLDNNPIEQNAFYKPIVLKRCPTLRLLDGNPLNEEERKAVLATLKRVEAKKEEENRQILMKARREQTLLALRDKFFHLHPHLKPESDFEQASENKSRNPQVADCIYEITGENMKFFGEASLEYLEKSQQIGIKTITFSYIDFDSIVPYLSKFKAKVPDVSKIEFYFNNLSSFNQINVMQFINSTLKDLVISSDGNPITSSQIFKTYIAYRLGNLELETLNDEYLTESDKTPSFLFSEKSQRLEDFNHDSMFSSQIGYLDYCSEILPENYPKQLREGNKIANNVITNSLRRKDRDECFNSLWSQVFSEAILKNLEEMGNMDGFTSKHLFQ